MEFVEFVKEYDRMCNSYEECAYCGLSRYVGNPLSPDCRRYCFGYPDVAQEVVQEWVEKNPVKTRKSVFLQAFPNAKQTPENIPTICAEEVFSMVCGCERCRYEQCVECWNTIIEE